MFLSLRNRASKFTTGFRSNTKGSLAIEFAAVTLPFLMLLFGILVAGLYYFTTFSLENAVEQAARQIRTGQAQLANKTKAQFKLDVCSKAPSFVDCANYLRVNVVEFSDFASVAPPSCLDGGGNLIPDPADDPVPGAAGEVVLVIVCYEWRMANILPFLKVGDMSNGSAMIQAATTFRTEPFS